jgi:hypothetical protein
MVLPILPAEVVEAPAQLGIPMVHQAEVVEAQAVDHLVAVGQLLILILAANKVAEDQDPQAVLKEEV